MQLVVIFSLKMAFRWRFHKSESARICFSTTNIYRVVHSTLSNATEGPTTLLLHPQIGKQGFLKINWKKAEGEPLNFHQLSKRILLVLKIKYFIL